MGWVWFAAIGAGAALLLWRMGVARQLWAFAGAALLLGGAGYALQGRPALGGTPVTAGAQPIEVAPGMVAFREAVFGRVTAAGAYLTAADAMTRIGDTDNAVKVILAGIGKMPDSVALWTGLGSALVTHDEGLVSPAAMFAFNRAMQLNPRHPGPLFFLGMAHVGAGEFQQARRAWGRALALTPPGLSYRPDIAARVALLDQYLAVAAEQSPAPPAPPTARR